MFFFFIFFFPSSAKLTTTCKFKETNDIWLNGKENICFPFFFRFWLFFFYYLCVPFGIGRLACN